MLSSVAVDVFVIYGSLVCNTHNFFFTFKLVSWFALSLKKKKNFRTVRATYSLGALPGCLSFPNTRRSHTRTPFLQNFQEKSLQGHFSFHNSRRSQDTIFTAGLSEASQAMIELQRDKCTKYFSIPAPASSIRFE